jgi:hypothetical protein
MWDDSGERFLVVKFPSIAGAVNAALLAGAPEQHETRACACGRRRLRVAPRCAIEQGAMLAARGRFLIGPDTTLPHPAPGAPARDICREDDASLFGAAEQTRCLNSGGVDAATRAERIAVTNGVLRERLAERAIP